MSIDEVINFCELAESDRAISSQIVEFLLIFPCQRCLTGHIGLRRLTFTADARIPVERSSAESSLLTARSSAGGRLGSPPAGEVAQVADLAQRRRWSGGARPRKARWSSAILATALKRVRGHGHNLSTTPRATSSAPPFLEQGRPAKAAPVVERPRWSSTDVATAYGSTAVVARTFRRRLARLRRPRLPKERKGRRLARRPSAEGARGRGRTGRSGRSDGA